MTFEKKEAKRKLHNFVFTWDMEGSTVVKAATLEKAEEVFHEDRREWLRDSVTGVMGSEGNQIELGQVYEEGVEGSDLTETVQKMKGEREAREEVAQEAYWASPRGIAEARREEERRKKFKAEKAAKAQRAKMKVVAKAS
jgi:hypothetical protein